MKVFPRVLELSQGERRCEFFIENSSSVNDTLLFKIRRTEPKVLDFHPKVGQIPAGASMAVSVRMTDPEAYSGRIIVKFVAIKTRKLCPNFRDSWDIGLSRGMAKKIVEVRNLELFEARPADPGDPRAQTHAAAGPPRSPPRPGPAECAEAPATAREQRGDGKPTARDRDREAEAHGGSAGRSQLESPERGPIDIDEAKLALDRAQELYHTVRGMNDDIRSDMARKLNSVSPRQMDRKINTESDSIATGIVGDLAYVDSLSLPMSPSPVKAAAAHALTPATAEKTVTVGFHGDGSPAAMGELQSESTVTVAVAVSGAGMSLPPRPERGDSARQFPKVEPSSPVVRLSGQGAGAALVRRDEPAASPVGDVRMHRHSPVSKGGILPGVSGPVSSRQQQPQPSSPDMTISIPSAENYGEDGFDSLSEGEGDKGEGGIDYSRSIATSADDNYIPYTRRSPQKEPDTNAHHAPDKRSGAAAGGGPVDHESVASQYCGSDEEYLEGGGDPDPDRRVREMEKYAKLEEAALACSEWRGVSEGSSPAKLDYAALLRDITNPVLSAGGQRLDSRKITAIVQQLSAAHQPLSELPIEEAAPSILEVAVSGSGVTDEVARMALRLRTAEIFYGGDMVTSIKIDNSIHFTSLWVLDEIFADNNTAGRSGDIMFSRDRIKQEKVHRARAGVGRGAHGEDANGEAQAGGMGSAFEDLLQTGVMRLAVTHCHSVHALPCSLLSGLRSLIHLDLSHNKIREIQGDLGLQLPFLKRINLSHNLLKSLDKLQGLPSLIALDASSNYIQTLHHGPHMLLPLARHLVSLNLLDNPICSLPSYAGETVSLLPNLICFDMRYTKLYMTRPDHSSSKHGGKSVPMLPSEANRSRVISVPRMDHKSGSPEGGHNFVVIKKPSYDSSPGYSARHSPSKQSKKKDSPLGGRGEAGERRPHRKASGSPELIPFYPQYGAFKASPGVLVETSSKGYGQPHRKGKAVGSPESVDSSSVSSVDSADETNKLNRRAMRAFKSHVRKQNSSKIKYDQGDDSSIGEKQSKNKFQEIRVNSKTRQLHPQAQSSSAQTLLSNLAAGSKPSSKSRSNGRGEGAAFIVCEDCANSVDTEARRGERRGSDEEEEDEQSLQSGSTVSDVSGHWDGKENLRGNAAPRRPAPDDLAPDGFSAVSGIASGSQSATEWRLAHDQLSLPGGGGGGHAPRAGPIADKHAQQQHHDQLYHQQLHQQHHHHHHQQQQQMQMQMQQHHQQQMQHQQQHQQQQHQQQQHQQQHQQRGRQGSLSARDRDRDRDRSPDRSVRSQASSARKGVFKLDLQDIFQRQHEYVFRRREPHTPILGTESLTRWQRGVERAALGSHRNLARSSAGR
jgi:hypothetical protein